MKIGIVTLPLGYNFGGIMQNYALQQVLKRLGHIPVTINYIEPHQRKLTDYSRFIASTLRTLLMRFHGKYRRFVMLRKIRIPKAQYFFMKSHLALTSPITNYTDVINEWDFDAYITGSDQVWRPKYTEHLKDMYLGFVSDPNKIHMAYAASFGVDTWEYSFSQEREARDLIKKFNAVSVREYSGIALCNDHLGVDAKYVLDPTMLLTKADYLPLCNSSRNDGKFIASYILDGYPERFDLIFDTCRMLGIRHKDIDPQKRSITDWLTMFRDASYIITDSFHGLAFSMIFNKPFIVLVNNDRGATRFISLLSTFGLENRIVRAGVTPADILADKIDWTAVNSRLTLMRAQSTEFLRTALKCVKQHNK